jgi:eukaryotic-like serine/threonine-protein kinase
MSQEPVTNAGLNNSYQPLSNALADRYRIERALGQGGMATVYLAHDIKHDRKVAVKVLKPELAAVLGAERFVVEIKTTASLQHPHILPLFDSGSADGFLYYVMPYIEGETLRSKLSRETQLGIDEAVRITTQVADALDYAHRHGVIHRDIKPENILLHDGRPMVADFGIALAVSAAAGGRMTETGLSLGTPHYMSPEQATAEKDISARSDQYSLASVLYEMLAGVPPHIGGSAQQIIMRIITDTARPVTELRKSVPANVAAAIAKALEKLPADRFASARDFAAALTNAGFTATGTAVRSVPQALTPRRRIASIAAIAAFGVIAFLTGRLVAVSSSDRDARATFSTLEPGPDEEWTLNATFEGFAISPNGREVALTVRTRNSSGIIIRSLDSLGARRLPNTAGATLPFWSPNGRSLGFFAEGRLRVIELATGSVRSLCPAADPQGGSWGADDIIIFAPEFGFDVFQTSATGGDCTRRITVPSGAQRRLRPQFLADGKHFVVGAADNVWLASMADDSVSLLVQQDSTSQQAVVGLPDFLLFTPPGAERTSFHAQRIDVDARRLVGPIVPLFRGVLGGGGRTAMMTSASGTLLVELPRAGGGRRFGRFQDGKWRDTASSPGTGVFGVFRASNDGRRLLGGGFRISVLDVRRNLWSDIIPQRTPPRPTTNPIWSPLDTAVAIAAGSVAATATDGTIRRFPTDSFVRPAIALDWSPDGRHIALQYVAGARAPHPEIWVLDVATGVRRRMFEETEAVGDLRFAPDGRRVAYGKGGSLFIRPFPGPGVAVRVIPGEGSRPVWSASGRSLYYFDADGNIAVVPVDAAGEAAAAPAIVVSKEQIEQLRPEYADRWFDVARGTNDLFVSASGNRRHTLTLVQNWPALLAQKR